MAIERAELRVISLPLVAPFAAGGQRLTERTVLLLRLDGDGLTGWGEVAAFASPWYSGETVDSTLLALRDYLLPAIIGHDLPDLAALLQLVAWVKGNRMAKAGLEMAWWDLHGRRSGRSLREMLGGVRDCVPVGVSVGLQPELAALVRVVSEYRGQGYGRIKIKVSPQQLEQPIRELRHAFGAQLPLQIDANSAFTLADVPRLAALDDAGLLLIEQPLADDDLVDHATLQAQLRTPVCLDESIDSRAAARAALALDACRVVNVKQGRVGGLSAALAIHALCLARGVPLWCGGMLESGIGRAANLALASLPGFTLPGDISATDRYYERDIIAERFVLNSDSTIDVPDGSGLGVTVDMAEVERVTLRREVIVS